MCTGRCARKHTRAHTWMLGDNVKSFVLLPDFSGMKVYFVFDGMKKALVFVSVY